MNSNDTLPSGLRLCWLGWRKTWRVTGLLKSNRKCLARSVCFFLGYGMLWLWSINGIPIRVPFGYHSGTNGPNGPAKRIKMGHPGHPLYGTIMHHPNLGSQPLFAHFSPHPAGSPWETVPSPLLCLFPFPSWNWRQVVASCPVRMAA